MKINLPFINIIEIHPMNQREAALNNPSNRVHRQIIFIVCVYILLTLSNRFTTKSNESDQILITKILNKNITSIEMTALIREISQEKLEGNWKKSGESESLRMPKGEGKFQILISRYSENSEQRISIDVMVKNGEYVDDGNTDFRIPELHTAWTVTKNPTNITAQFPLNENKIKVSFIEEQIFHTVRRGQFNLTNISLAFIVENRRLVKVLNLATENETISFDLKPQRYNMSGTILLALILFIIAYCEFTACLTIMRKFIEGEQNPTSYSFTTLTLAMMWDSALCITSFVQAFRNQENIVLFIVPAFILCLLFSNLELKILATVFQAWCSSTDTRCVMLKFKLLNYVSVIIMYLLLIGTNMGTPLFLIFSLIFLPQIYTNAVVGKRPNPNSMYYNQFLLYRFLIVLYLKCFPYNIFELKPNYLLGFGCLLIVGCQVGLLWIQKIYGPKKVLPKFLLPPLYNYSPDSLAHEYSTNNSEAVCQQCSICLQSLRKNPEIPENYNEVVPKVMKTPCGHKYHGICLVQWMKLKMECPQCRAKLPPFE